MKRLVCLAAAALLCGAAYAAAGPYCHGPTCIFPPASCPDCTDPCCHALSLNMSPDKPLCELNAHDCCARIRAARKLGHKLCYNFCVDDAILGGLVHSLLADPCWEVRKQAAWSIAMQGARTDYGVLALYLSSKLDPHYMVRDRAIMSLDVLLVGDRQACFKEAFRVGDDMVKTLRKEKALPGSDKANLILSSFPGTAPSEVIPMPLPKN